MKRNRFRLVIGAFGVLAWASAGPSAAAGPTTEVEEVVASCRNPDNGAGPFWAYGSPMMVRVGDLVFASVMEAGEGVPPLCNTRWRLFRRDEKGWADVLHPSEFRQREPCPLVTVGSDRLMLSVNTSKTPPGTKYEPCDPHLLAVDVKRPGDEPARVDPNWQGSPAFTDHSYRGIAADGRRGEILLLNIDSRTGVHHWALIGADGRPVRHGGVEFTIRSCYEQVVLRDRAAHVLAIGDIVEPVQEWRDYKHEKTGASWDYVFRRLFYARNPDVAAGDFEPPIEVDSVDATAGHITNLDLWLDPAGVVHLLYLKTSIQTSLLRDRFFPGQPIVKTLEYATIEDGRVVRHEPLVNGGEGRPETPAYGRFHVAADGTLYAVLSVQAGVDGSTRLENRLRRLLPTRDAESTKLDLKHPFWMFSTATERGGSAASDTLDLIGPGGGDEIRYARVRLR